MSLVDQLIIGFDKALRTSTGNTTGSNRPSPAREISADNLTSDERDWHALCALIIVAFAPRRCICGQALTAKSGRVANAVPKRLKKKPITSYGVRKIKELDASVGKLNPVWYAARMPRVP